MSFFQQFPRPFCFAAALGVPAAVAETTFGTDEKFAYSANSGWISFRHDRPTSPQGVVFGEAFLSGLAYSANLGWINLGDGFPANGYRYSNLAGDHGVNHDSQGNLSGYAWSANTGWINFGWATVSDSNRPRVDLRSGAFSGFAWGSNTGWINLGNDLLVTQSMQSVDSDDDGIPDWWEWREFNQLTTADASSDTDGDGVTDRSEYIADTDPDDSGGYLRIVNHSHILDVSETTLEFTSSPSRLYCIEYSNDLGLDDPWTESSPGTFTAGVGTTTTRTITYPGNPSKFFRVVAIIPLQE